MSIRSLSWQPNLRPVLFGSRSNLPYESNYHSFVGDVVCGRLIIAACRKYLWGSQFYWLWGCIAVKEVLEYNDSIHQLKRWSQKILAYEFVCIHRPNKMMMDVDSICRHIDPLISHYLLNTATIHFKDINLRPFAYNFDVFFSSCFLPQPTTLWRWGNRFLHVTTCVIVLASCVYICCWDISI